MENETNLAAPKAGQNNPEEALKLAVALHGHLAPGIALGVRMTQLAMERLNINRGNKRLLGVAESSRCIADAMQAASGATLGHGNAFVYDYGKLAVTLGRSDTGFGFRVSLRGDAAKFSQLMKRWVMREARLTRQEEEELGYQLLHMPEDYFEIKQVRLAIASNFNSSKIVACEKCGENVPETLLAKNNGSQICKPCAGEAYYLCMDQKLVPEQAQKAE